MSEPVRRFTDPETGERYRVYLAPPERSRTPHLKALVFESESGERAVSVPLYHTITLDGLSERNLEALLGRALGRK